MILQELCKVYDRLKNDPSYGIPRRGVSLQKISFIVVLNPDGTLFDIQDARIQNGKKMITREMLVPGETKQSGSGLNPCILWDNASYLLGWFEPKNPERPTADEEKKALRAPKAFEKSRETHLALREKILAEPFQSVVRFFEKWTPAQITPEVREKLRTYAGTGFGVFQICGEPEYVHEIPEVRNALETLFKSDADPRKEEKQCLVSGDFGKIARLHKPTIKGISGSQSSGAMLVSFNIDAAESYGKEQGENAPVSEDAANRYCVALNALLKNKKNRFRLGEATVVFWTGTKTEVEGDLATMFGLEDKTSTQDSTQLQRVQTFLENLRNAGTPQTALAESGYGDDAETPFFMLGISPNAARLAIRFWHAGTLGRFLENLRAHHQAMQIQPRNKKFNDPEFIPLWTILLQTARDADGIPPLLGGALLRAVIENLPYPMSLIQLVLNRIRIESRVNYVRASILKAFLTRNKQQKITMSLDTSNKNPAYLLGRLFATLEKAQAEAIPEANAGIRERFYASASATPRAVFPVILRTFPHWIAKLNRGREIFFSKLVQEIIDGINAQSGFPAHLNLTAQSFFAIGYYQQMQDFFRRNNTSDEAETADAGTPEPTHEE